MEAAQDRRDWFFAATWVLIVVFVAAFWASAAYGVIKVYGAITSKPKPDPAHIACTESARGPHGRFFDTGTAIVCFHQR